ncbi:MAG: DUF6443 domain-containing protein [Rhodothermales bacterium]
MMNVIILITELYKSFILICPALTLHTFSLYRKAEEWLKHSLLLALGLAFSCTLVSAQNIASSSIGIQSPTAASLGKFGDTPVSYYTGQANVSIPLTRLDSRALSVPIALRYNGGSGIRVEETPGWIGMGWALDAGGVITRTMRALPDDRQTHGYLDNANELASIWSDLEDYENGVSFLDGSGWTTEVQTYIEAVHRGDADPEPDQFFFNFAGRSGKIVMASETDIYTIPNMPLDIKIDRQSVSIPGTSSSIAQSISQITITSEDGTKYIFGTTTSDFESLEFTHFDLAASIGLAELAYVSAWYLRRIESANGDDVIDFSYASAGAKFTHQVKDFHEEYIPISLVDDACIANAPSTQPAVDNFQHHSSIYLTEITGDNGMKAVFNSSNRAGYMAPDYRKLDKIEIKGRNGALIRSFDFSYAQKSEFSNRLLLTSVEEKGESGAGLLAPYQFSYYGESGNLTLPNRFSNDTDHRGYFNNAGNNTDLSTVVYIDPNGDYRSYLRAWREPDEEAMKTGVLKTITYPTQGFTEYEYEGHSYSRFVAPGDLNDYRQINEATTAEFIAESALGEVIPLPKPFIVEGDFDATIRIEALFNSELFSPESALFVSGQLTGATPGDGQIAWIRIIDATGAEVYYYEHEHDCSPSCPQDQEFNLDESFTLSPGNYSLEVGSQLNEVTGDETSVEVGLNWVERKTATERLAGGLRIKQITQQDNTDANSPDRIQRFVYERNDGLSSGVLSGEPRHYYVKHDGGNCVELFNSTSAMGMLGVGQELGYSRIEVFYASDDSNGKSEFTFHTADEGQTYRDDSLLDSDLTFDPYQKLWPFARLMSLGYKRGAEKDVTHFEKDGTLKAVAKSTQTYFDSYFDDATGSSDLTRLVPALAVRKDAKGQNETPQTYIKRFYLLSARHHLKTKINHEDNGSGGLTQMLEQEFFYDNNEHLQLTKLVEKAPGRSDRITEYKYAHELGVNSGMKTENMLLQKQWTQISEGTTLLRKNWTEWKSWSDGYWRPEKEWIWKGGSDGGDIPSTSVAEELATYVSYDNFGNLTESKDARGNSSTFTWGQDNSVPTVISINSNVVGTQVSTADYDANTLRVTKTTNPAGVQTSFGYDALGRLDEIKNDAGLVVSSYNYHINPNYVESTNIGGTSPDIISRTYADGFGAERQSHIKMGSNAIVSASTLDNMGRMDKSYKPYEANNGVASGWGWFHTGYDSKAKTYYGNFLHDNNRPYIETDYLSDPLSRISNIWPEGVTSSSKTVKTDYGTSGNFMYVKETDENGNQTTSYVDAYGNADRIEAALSTTTNFTYDVLGQLKNSESPTSLTTSYEYDDRGQMIKKTSPDAEGDFEYKYDISGNLRFIEDPNQRASNDYLYIKYDDFNRPIEEGIYTGSTTFDNADVDADNFPTGDKTVKKSYIYNSIQLQEVAFHHKDGSSGSYTYTYDNEGRISQLDIDLPDLAARTIDYTYDLQGRPKQVVFEQGKNDAFYHWYEYDEAGRLKQVKVHTIDNEASATEAATYSYLADGSVESLKLGPSSNPVQTLDYTYHVRGFLASINDPDNLTDSNSLLGDAFGIELAYEDNPGWPASFTSQDNGNIASAKWSTRDNNAVGGSRSGYSFFYDDLNRLKEADYNAYNGSWLNSSLFNLNSVTYDKAGNITSLHRNNDAGSGTSWTYSYTPGTNRMSSVTNHGTYSYDANGNITDGELTEGIDSILAYDYRNLPETITTGGSTFIYRYDASGQRVYSSADPSHYIRGASGEVVAVYDGSGNLRYWNLLAGSDVIGRRSK